MVQFHGQPCGMVIRQVSAMLRWIWPTRFGLWMEWVTPFLDPNLPNTGWWFEEQYVSFAGYPKTLHCVFSIILSTIVVNLTWSPTFWLGPTWLPGRPNSSTQIWFSQFYLGRPRKFWVEKKIWSRRFGVKVIMAMNNLDTKMSIQLLW